MTTPRRSRSGCYGFRLSGLREGSELLGGAGPDWPLLELRRGPVEGDAPTEDRIGPERAELPLHAGWVAIDRRPARATFRVRGALADRELIHPYLAPVAAVAARWAGRESFHAGAVVAGGGAWVVLGDKEQGKSTTLAWLALQGHDVLADDLIVLDGASALAGPRCIDLRAESARHLGAGEPLGVVGMRERWRLTLGPVAEQVPLRGWISLAWADEVAIEALRGPERMLTLFPHRSVRLVPGAPEALVDLSSLPVWRLSRPRRWDSLADAGGRLLDVIGA